MSVSTAASLTSVRPGSSTSEPAEPTASNVGSTFASSKIIRVTVAAGIIVLGLTAIVLFFKISSWLRFFRRRKRRREVSKQRQEEEDAVAYEIAAWSDHPGTAHLTSTGQTQTAAAAAAAAAKEGRRRGKRHKERDKRLMRRAGGNAYTVYEWEGVAQ